LAEAHELLGALLHLSSTQGEIHLYSAEWEPASESFRRGLALAEELGNLERQAGYRAGLALAARGERDLSGATTLLEEALLLISGHGYWHLRARLLIWLAETLLQAGRVAEAWQHLNAALETSHLHGRALLQLQAERLRARLLAAGGDWPAAKACFAQVASQAARLDIPIEVARTQAAWGQAMLQYDTAPGRSDILLSQARRRFVDYQARADLDALQL
jgi:tetratricopeptide (TPR) repeat protein